MIKTLFTIAASALLLAGAAQADIQHIVIFKYQPQVDEAARADIARRFLGLKDIARRDGKPYIVSILGGKAMSREGFEQGFEEAFIVTFKTASDRDYFVGKPYRETMDPDHMALAKVAEPLLTHDPGGKLTGLYVFDFDDQAAR
jgi:hypothetical protein